MKKLEELLNLPPKEEEVTEEKQEPTKALELAPVTEVTVEEKIDTALAMISDMREHDSEMDSIAKEAISAYEELKELAMNVSEGQAARILEVAANLLNTALSAKNSKANRRLKTVDLQLKKLRIDRHYNKSDGAPAATGNEFDRNELLKRIVNNPNK